MVRIPSKIKDFRSKNLEKAKFFFSLSAFALHACIFMYACMMIIVITMLLIMVT